MMVIKLRRVSRSGRYLVMAKKMNSLHKLSPLPPVSEIDQTVILKSQHTPQKPAVFGSPLFEERGMGRVNMEVS